MKNTKIEWTQDTWNPLRGCSRVSEACRNCYAETVAGRFSGPGQPYEGLVTKTAKGQTWNGNIKLVPEKLEEPLRWMLPRMIFVNSMSDLFHESVPDEYIDQVFAVMAVARRHTFQILTKRPERMREYMGDMHPGSKRVIAIRLASAQFVALAGYPKFAINFPLPNVWLGVSVENQATADERIPLLLQTPAAVRWISAEPLLGAINLRRISLGTCDAEFFGNPSIKRAEFTLNSLLGAPKTGIPGLDWVVVGGESGKNARPMHPDWARSLRDQCQAAEVPFFFKQWGEWEISSFENGHFDCCMATNNSHWVHIDGVLTKPSSLRPGVDVDTTSPCAMVKVGKKSAGRLLDGVLHDAYPEVTR